MIIYFKYSNHLVMLVFFMLFSVQPLRPQEENTLSPYSIILKRNVFNPLWAVSLQGNDTRARKEELEALKKAEEERKAKERTDQEQNLIASKKKEIEANYSLNGIVFEKGRKQAVISDKRDMEHFLYENDMLGESKIISIDPEKSEVTLDYQGKFTVTLGMQ
ncbi:MAG: hypothetical protein LHV68_06425 [Elusimicrobia bacterium]|nr:hypothetical protein [Candidatus Liberimonas magnetica]